MWGRNASRFLFSVEWFFLFDWVDLIAWEVIASNVVCTNSSWISHDESFLGVRLFIFSKVLNISFWEFSTQTTFHVFDFLGNTWVFLIESGLINKSLVQKTFKEKIEIRHESSIVTILVFIEDWLKSHVNFIWCWVDFISSGEATKEFETSEEGNTPDIS